MGILKIKGFHWNPYSATKFIKNIKSVNNNNLEGYINSSYETAFQNVPERSKKIIFENISDEVFRSISIYSSFKIIDDNDFAFKFVFNSNTEAQKYFMAVIQKIKINILEIRNIKLNKQSSLLLFDYLKTNKLESLNLYNSKVECSRKYKIECKSLFQLYVMAYNAHQIAIINRFALENVIIKSLIINVEDIEFRNNNMGLLFNIKNLKSIMNLSLTGINLSNPKEIYYLSKLLYNNITTLFSLTMSLNLDYSDYNISEDLFLKTYEKSYRLLKRKFKVFVFENPVLRILNLTILNDGTLRYETAIEFFFKKVFAVFFKNSYHLQLKSKYTNESFTKFGISNIFDVISTKNLKFLEIKLDKVAIVLNQASISLENFDQKKK